MKRKRKNKRRNIGSILTGLILGILVSIYALGFFIAPSLNIQVFIIGGSIAFFTYLGYSKPKFTELLAYAIAIFIILQFLWDWRVGDRGAIRLELFINALVSLVINIFTGKVKFIGAKSTAKRAIGLK